ncbi:unnamed protein product [Rhizoctonia solani]|uniref:Transmembrane protein n=1 Tax=Rhizoctonia solani TaxID=456999 RepID=A0A8H3GU27_9AGAM|nr:unnamed protein product [Rhizoctonia solani]
MTTYGVHSLDFPFRGVWTILDRQKDWLTSTAISPSDYKAGVLVGILDFESKFYPTTAIWRSDTILVFGCSNGVVYHLDFEHKSRRPVSVHALVKPLKSPVRAIAFDTFRDMLGIACGGEVWIYVRTIGTGTETWDCVDYIPAPCGGAAGLVTALCFFGTTLSRRHLFIGHAKAGWTIWFAPRSYHRTPFTDSEDGDVCTIGSATIPFSEQFIAIATLDNAFVTYSLKEGGPVVDTQFKVKSREATGYCAVLLIVSTSSDLVLKGTVAGDIEVLDLKTHSTASLHHAHNHIIRTLNAYGDKVVVGSSDLTENSSGCLRCYTISTAAEPQDWRRIDEPQGPIFEITLNSILPFSERGILCDPLGMLSIGHTVSFKLRWKRSLVFLLVGLGVLLLALALDPPSRVSSVSTRDVQILRTPNSRSATPSRNPTLSTLIRWCAGYISSQVSEWVTWSIQFAVWMAKLVSYGGLMAVKNLFFALTSFTRVVFLIPRFLKGALGEVPDILANFICDILRIYGFDDVCPE